MRKKAILLSSVITATTVGAGVATSSLLDRMTEPAVVEAASPGKAVWITPSLKTLDIDRADPAPDAQRLAAS